MLTDRDTWVVAEAMLRRLGPDALPVGRECATMALERSNLEEFVTWLSVIKVVRRLLNCNDTLRVH
jgi:hypothetical protein